MRREEGRKCEGRQEERREKKICWKKGREEKRTRPGRGQGENREGKYREEK